MKFENLLPVAMQLGNDIWLLWGFHTTVAVAVIGWIIAKRPVVLSPQIKIVTSIAYGTFFVVICISFLKAYRDWFRILTDLKESSQSLSLKLHPDGYIQYILNRNFYESIMVPILVCIVFFLIVIFLIWSDGIWVCNDFLKSPEGNWGSNSGAVAMIGE
jgi:hypothetical protein